MNLSTTHVFAILSIASAFVGASGCLAELEETPAQAAVVQPLAIASGLRGYFPFNGNALDETVHGNNATVTGATLVRDRFGNPASAFSFDGNDNIRIPALAHEPALFSQDFAISFWLRSSHPGRMYAFSVDGSGCTSANLNIELNDASGYWAYWNSGGTTKIQGGSVGEYADGRWHHIVLRRTGTTVQLLIDGVDAGSASAGATTIGSNARDIYLGANRCFGSPPPQNHGWRGEIDDVSIYDRALSDNEVLVLARNGLVASYPFTTGPVDESGFGNTAVVSGATPAPDRFGNTNAAYSFDGNDQIRIPPLLHAMNLFDGDFTLASWMQTNVATPMNLLFMGTACTENNLNVELNNSAAVRTYWNGTSKNLIDVGTSGQYANNVWRHVALRRNKYAGVVSIFIDGVLAGSRTYTDTTVGSNMLDLLLGQACGPSFQGKIDDVSIHARALGDGEIKLQATSGLAASFRFEGGAVDDSGHGNRAEVVGVYQVPDRSGLPQSAFTFYGSDFVRVPPLGNVPDLYSGDFTLSFLQHSAATSRMYGLSIDPGDGNQNNLNIEFNDGSGVWTYWNSGGTTGMTHGAVGAYTTGAWRHVLLRRRRNPDSIDLFIDGTLRATRSAGTGTIGSNTGSLYLGARRLGSTLSYGWHGGLDDLQIFNRAVSDAEVARIKSDDRPRILSPAPGVAWTSGSQHYITWLGSPSTANKAVTVQVTTNGGVTWTTLGNSTTKRMLWTVPSQQSTNARVRITAVADPSFKQESPLPFSITPSQAASYTWTKVTNAMNCPGGANQPAARDGAGALVFDNQMFLIGGWSPERCPRTNSEVWSSTNGATWCPSTIVAPWEGRHTAGYVVQNGNMRVIGGDANRGHYQNDQWRSTDGANWTQEILNPSPPGWRDRALHHVVTFGNDIWLFGGQKMEGLFSSCPPGGSCPVDTCVPTGEALYNDAWVRTPTGSGWTRYAEGAPWAPRGMIGGSVQMMNRIWLLGGGTYSTARYTERTYNQDVWSSPDGVTWDRVVDYAPWKARQYHDVAVFDSRMWVLEGFDGELSAPEQGNRNDVWYSADGVNWYELPNTPWQARHAASVFVHAGALWMVGGIGRVVDAQDLQVWKLTPN